MKKGGKRYSSMSSDGKWFAHPESPRSEPRNRETSTSTGMMLTQAKSSLPQALHHERYPKGKTEQKPREYPHSDHDNRHALKDDVFVFNRVGRRKCLDETRQHNSHFCLCDDEADRHTAERTDLSAYRTDFVGQQAVHVPTSTRQFPRNHQKKCAEAALAQAGEQFMWFGQHNSDPSETLRVPAATNSPASTKH